MLTFQYSYTSLPNALYSIQSPTPVHAPTMVLYNEVLAQKLGITNQANASQLLTLLAGNDTPATSFSQAYAGHQFGHFNILGDGRAHVLGEWHTGTITGTTCYDIQLKGSGRSPYSRSGDGRAALAPMLREYIISEAMHALGIPTTRALAVVTTGEPVWREQPQPGAILTRIARSHIRVGTFQYAALQDTPTLKALADYTIKRHYPELTDAEQPYLALLLHVGAQQAMLVSQWMRSGFIHGVLNTDNVAISGETIDYGPCAFMEHYNPATVFSFIDKRGRYAYENQPAITCWNLARLAEALLPLLADDEHTALDMANTAMNTIKNTMRTHWHAQMVRKLGFTQPTDAAINCVQAFLDYLHTYTLDFTNSFRHLNNFMLDSPEYSPLFAEYADWYASWQHALQAAGITPHAAHTTMQTANPAIIPRNHQVHAALEAAENGNLQPTQQLLHALQQPYTSPQSTAYTHPATADERVMHTFCGT